MKKQQPILFSMKDLHRILVDSSAMASFHGKGIVEFSTIQVDASAFSQT